MLIPEEKKDPFQNLILPDKFNRKYAPLNSSEYPIYHNILSKSNHPEFSYKIENCGIDGMRLTCSNDYRHSYVIPINCGKRTCPECSRREMLERFHQFKPLLNIIEETNSRPGDKLPQEWRCRFVTLTCKSKKDTDINKPIEAVKKAFYEFWRNVYGVKSKFAKYSEIIGGLWFLEVQSGWNVHLHGIVLSPFISTDYLQKIWKKYIEFYGWFGWICHQEVIYSHKDDKGNAAYDGNYSGSLFEVLSYPVKPDKKGRHDEKLLASLELAMYQKRRMYLKGSWYNKFPHYKHEVRCPICDAEFTILQGREEQKLFGNTFNESVFSYTEEGFENFKNFGKGKLNKDFFCDTLKRGF
jgi:hypothetical protein